MKRQVSASASPPVIDSNQNYVNDNSLILNTSSASTQFSAKSRSQQTVTPVVISVQLPEGGRVETNTDGTKIIATPGSVINKEKRASTISPKVTQITQSKQTSPVRESNYSVVNKHRTVTQQTSNSYSPTHVQTNGSPHSPIHENNQFSYARPTSFGPGRNNFKTQTSYQKVAVAAKSSPTNIAAQAAAVAASVPPPPPPPPPIAEPPPISPIKPQSIVLPKEANRKFLSYLMS